jgi:hypothetical protein
MFQLMVFVAIFGLLLLSQSALAQEQIIREIEPSVDHGHCTTRQFQHKTFYHEGIWFVFYSDGTDFWYQTSSDSGRTWLRASEPVDKAPNGSSGFDILKKGDAIYISHPLYPLGRYDVNAPYAKGKGEYPTEGRIKKGKIEGREIHWLSDINPGFAPGYSNIVQDAVGYFWVFTRDSQQAVAYRSRNPNDIREWMPKTVCIAEEDRHAADAAALDSGKLYVVSMLTPSGKLYGNLYDGQKWGRESTLVADNVTDVAGDDRRLSLEFDPVQKRLHLVYVDAESKLRYRYLGSPYGSEDWQPALSEPGLELAEGIFTSALSVDTSRTPYDLVITYGVEKHVGEDKRFRTGELCARRFDGKEWQGEAILVSQPGTVNNWYPSVNQDVRDGICVMYARAMTEVQAVMVSTGVLQAEP